MKTRNLLLTSLAVGAATVLVVLALSPSESPGIRRTRTADLTYDAATTMVEVSYDTTMLEDRFVERSWSKGSVPWGKRLGMETDPTGGEGHNVAADPSGTVYAITVTWYDANRSPTGSITRTVAKP